MSDSSAGNSTKVADGGTSLSRAPGQVTPENEDYIASDPDRVLSAEEGIALKERVAALQGVKQWRWMNHYDLPEDLTRVANSPPACLAGELIALVRLRIDGTNRLIYAAWMFF